MPDHEREFGPEHPDTLWARTNFAWYTGAAGDPAAARDLFAEWLAVRERLLGPDHPATAITRADLARWGGRGRG